MTPPPPPATTSPAAPTAAAAAAGDRAELVRVRDERRVRILTLNRPDARNALSASLRIELIEALRAAEQDTGIGAVVLTGAGSA
jgi:enoyl-CoA hydratase/carnithine racemase